MVRPELRLRGRSASEEDEESLCDTVLCCIFLVMRCVRLRCVWFCVLLLDLGSQALVYACVSSCVLPNGGVPPKCLLCDKLKRGSAPPKCLLCDYLMWLSRSWGWLVHCLSVYHLPGWGNGAFGSGLDLTILSCLCYVLKVDYIVMWLPCDVLIRLG